MKEDHARVTVRFLEPSTVPGSPDASQICMHRMNEFLSPTIFRPDTPCPGPIYRLSRTPFHVSSTPESSTPPSSSILSLAP